MTLYRWFKFKDEEAVSEVVGTILTLGITVVLFSSVYATVTTLEAPERRDHVEMVAVYEREGDIDYINITHQSGRSLDIGSLSFNLLADPATENRLGIDDEEVNFDDDTWSVGEEVRIEGEIFEHDDTELELLIRNEDTHRIVHQTVLAEEVPDQLDIGNTYISYIYDWRNYAEQDEEITIVAVLSDIGDIDAEDINVTASVTGGHNPFKDVETVTLTSDSRRDRYNETVEIASQAREKSYSVRIRAEFEENSTEEYVRLNVGERPAERYPRELEIGRINYFPSSPSHGDGLEVTVEVYNQGPENFTTDWNMTDHYKEQDPEGAEGTTTFLHGPAPTEISGEWDIKGSGRHEIEIEIEGDEEWEGAKRSFEIYVDPHVLIVEDRSAAELPEMELMGNALDGLNLDHETRSLGEYDDEEDIEIDYERHSVVIWLTGNKTGGEKTSLLGEVADDLADYIEEDNGTVWLKGSNLDEIDPGEELSEKLGGPDFSDSDEGERKLEGHEDGTFGDFKFGITAEEEHPRISNPGSFEEENRLTEVGGDEEVFGVGYEDEEDEYRTATTSFLFRSIEDPGMRTALVGEVIGWTTNITVRSGVDVAVTSQIIRPSAPMYEDDINITARFRNNGPEDLTLNNTVRLVRNDGEEVISPPEDANLFLPANGGTANVTFTWMADELGVQQFLVKADYFGEIDQVNPRTNDIRYKNLEITDDQIYVNVHYSTLVVDADLSEEYDHFNTTGELIDSFERLGHVEGRDFDIFEVETDGDSLEDGPDDDMMGNYNAVLWVTGERNYEGEDNPAIFTDRGADDDDLSNIIDYLEQDGGANMMFMGEYILDFLEDSNHGDSDDIIEYFGIDGLNGRKETGMLKGQENNLVGHGSRYTLEEEAGPNYTTFEINETDDAAEVLFKGDGGENFASTYDDGSAKTVYMGVNLERISGPLLKEGAFDDWLGGDVDTSAESAKTEFVYTSLWSFGKSTEGIEMDGEVQLEGRPELRVTDYDIRLTTDRPHTGRSYEIRAEIENLGDRGASTLVRLHDGEDYIGAENLYVEASERSSEPGSSYFEVESGTATAEVSWKVSEPGIRDLIVRVDPEREVNELEYEGNKIMEFNNRAEIEQPVYFFYDDMEEGEQKWRHDETMVNIDGSGPLDFADRRDMETNVEGDWDHGQSGMTDKDGNSVSGEGYYETDDEDVEDFTDKAHYSSPRSYWMPETPAGMEERQPVDVVMVIDNSGSMDGTPLAEAQRAAKDFVDNLTKIDRVALFAFDPDSTGDEEPWLVSENYTGHEGDKFWYMDEENDGNRSDMKDAIDSLSAECNTPIWDTMGGAIRTAVNSGRSDAYTMTMSLTDGDDYGTDGTETGSETYAPGALSNTDYDDRTWGHLDGNVWGDQRSYNNQGGTYYDVLRSWDGNDPEWEWIDDATRKGLLEAPVPSYTIGLGISPHEDDPENPSIGDNYPFTTEYDLWRIAETSDAGYYFAPEPGDLSEIFQDIYDEIPGRRGGIRSVSPDDGSTLSSNQQIASIEEEYEETIQIEEPTYFRYTTTPSIEIVDTTAEKLRFRNKFWMTEGTNGGIMYLWGSDDGNWDWEKDTRRYIRPEQSYTGNLDFEETDNHTDEGGLMINDDHPEGTGLIDREGEKPYWAFNGKSAGGTFGWRHTSVDLEGYEDFMENHTEIRVVFVTAQMGGISEEAGWEPEMGWYIDNVNMRVTREFDEEEVVPEDGHGYWMRVNKTEVMNKFDVAEDHDHIVDEYYDDHTPGENGDGHFWMFATKSNDEDNYGEPALPEGVDSSLYTSRIDLSNADRPELSAYMKFNLDNHAGTPPDGLRIEISEDDGRTWDSLTYGIRSGWGVSGEVPNNLEDEDAEEEWENYSGGSDGYDWIDTDSLSRVSADLSGWRGEQVILRFRVFTNTTDTYEDELDDFEYDDDYPKAVMIDDVIVKEADMDEDIDQDSTLETEDVSDGELSSVSEDDSEDQDIRSMISKEAQEVYRDSQIMTSRLERRTLMITRELEDVMKEREFNYW